MRKLVLYALTIVSLLFFIGSADAAPIVIGAPANDLNCIPFGCQLGAGSRYQQVYSSAAFPGPMLINEIQFYQTISGDLNVGAFEIYLSTTSLPVNGLDIFDFESNLGADNSAFAVVSLIGSHSAAPNVLSIAGSPFLYTPALGNLLLDIIIQGGATHPGANGLPPGFQDNAFFDASTSGVFSRAHNFGTGFENIGLVTRFNTTLPEPSSLSLLGAGVACAIARVRRRKHRAA